MIRIDNIQHASGIIEIASYYTNSTVHMNFTWKNNVMRYIFSVNKNNLYIPSVTVGLNLTRLHDYQYSRFVVGNTDLIFSSCFFYVRTMSSFKQYVQNMEGRQALNQLLMYLDIEQYNAILPAKKMQKTQQATLIYK